MNYLRKLVILLLLALSSRAQSRHYIYLQTEDSQPFYVKIKNQVYSSAESGYLIMPKLEEGRYSLIIGFPGNQLPSQNFDVEIKDKDKGFVIKGEKNSSFSLMDLQSSELLLPFKDRDDLQVNSKKSEKGDFPSTLALVTDNPSILEEDNFDENSSGSASNKLSSQKIVRIFSKKETSGYTLKYLIKEGGKADTVVIFISNDSKKNKREKTEAKSACKEIATDADFIQLRRKMTAEDNEEKMTLVAKAAFNEKCYNTEQIKYLSALFINDNDRIGFMEAIYPFVIDKLNFRSLQSMLTEEKNQHRFKMLIQQ